MKRIFNIIRAASLLGLAWVLERFGLVGESTRQELSELRAEFKKKLSHKLL